MIHKVIHYISPDCCPLCRAIVSKDHTQLIPVAEMDNISLSIQGDISELYTLLMMILTLEETVDQEEKVGMYEWHRREIVYRYERVFHVAVESRELGGVFAKALCEASEGSMD